MRVIGILWGRRPPSAGGGPVLKRRPARRAGRRPNHLSPLKMVFDCKWYKNASPRDFIPEAGPMRPCLLLSYGLNLKIWQAVAVVSSHIASMGEPRNSAMAFAMIGR